MRQPEIVIAELLQQIKVLKELLIDAVHWNSMVNAQEKIDWDNRKKQALKK